jgi:hypothetical protein
MAANPYDQFDANPYDQFDAAPQPQQVQQAPARRTVAEEGERQAGLMGRMAVDTFAALPLAARVGRVWSLSVTQ